MRGSVWSVCDRCGFNYHRNTLRKEATGHVVCRRCFDGSFDKKRHPQNYPARHRLDPSVVPDGRPPLDLTAYILQEDGGFLLQEDGGFLIVSDAVWTPELSSPG